jgi:hypothetical protein
VSGGIAPHILNLDTRWRRVVNFMSMVLYSQGKSLQYLLDIRLGGPKVGLNTVLKRKILAPAAN